MLFAKRLRDGIRRGRVRCTVRIWMRPHVKVGGRDRMDDGHVVVDAITPIELSDITYDLARESGFDSVEDLLRIAKHGPGENVTWFASITCRQARGTRRNRDGARRWRADAKPARNSPRSNGAAATPWLARGIHRTGCVTSTGNQKVRRLATSFRRPRRWATLMFGGRRVAANARSRGGTRSCLDLQIRVTARLRWRLAACSAGRPAERCS